MPVTLHPLILFALLAKMPAGQLLLCILAGRTVKYSIMALCAHAFPTVRVTLTH